jgi:glutamine amidotransferase PdxT
MVRQGAIWGLTFHPELSGDLTLQRAFLKQLR